MEIKEMTRIFALTKIVAPFYNNYLLYSLKILIIMVGVVLIPMAITGDLQLSPILGAVAAALSDLDDHIKGRVKNIGSILLIFFLAATIVEILFPYPPLFLLLCILGTSALMMLGALGERYATTAFGTLVLMVYAMLTLEPDRAWYIQPLTLLTGALWYHLISLLFHIIWPARPITESLGEAYRDLAHFLELKARFFDPDEGESIQKLKLKLSIAGKTLTTRLNSIKGALIRRLQNEQSNQPYSELLNYYLVAQAIYERASSIHVEYEILHKEFLYSDLLFRYQRVMMQQGNAAQKVAEALLHKKEYLYPQYLSRITSRLEETTLRLKKDHAASLEIIISIENILHNLKQINTLLLKMESGLTDSALFQAEIKALIPDKRGSKIAKLKEMALNIYQTINAHLTKESEIFRHAVRMGFVMGTGYLIIWGINLININILENGPVTNRIYWIVLTAIFVCQPNVIVTKSRILKRLSGTFIGVLLTLLFLQFSPSTSLQVLLVIASSTLFFSLSALGYSFTTALITIMVLISFNLNDYDFIAPERLIDTIIGCAIAWFAARYILPDWRYHNIQQAYHKVAEKNSEYLKEIQAQYHHGRHDSLSYLSARARANETDSELAALFASLSESKGQDEALLSELFNNLCLNNTFLGYLSALGAHRTAIENQQVLQLFNKTSDFIIQTLQQQQFNRPAYSQLKREIVQLQQHYAQSDLVSSLLLQQLTLLLRTLPSYLKALFKA
ncbi:TIGR01666 family membrane protein [Ignatzschineria cameli]|uniref:TIGR01666 family membrane protein n=2 Tax=Ignatzschineria cameli TaxID=2182793 RepID=A0A2U2AR81_9GAMM|nr:TIGR01666 family membrane protein [Ignatzschineria cameli]PWD89777.1 TIGR01666 family membrane protein [Ignatzschineria cameli]PWD91427.1 TIGR01666 family membrane protein [Ignatzschineria cameli]PWD92465.1 TIGR01666 family membrane protein [Ignatzschineria cameli]